MGILGMKSRLCATLLSASFLLSVAVLPGCGKKKDPDPQFVSKHDSLDALSEIKKATDAGVKFHPQGEISKYDGERYFEKSFNYEMKDFVNALLEVDMEYVDDWDTDKLKYPVYEIFLGASDNTIEDTSQLTDEQKKAAHPTFNACWSDGYLITASGDVLKCDTDFEKLIEGLGEYYEFKNFRYAMPVYSRITALWHDKWYPENMITLDDYLKERYSGNDSMSIEEADKWGADFKSRDSENITVTITNVSAPELIYGDEAATVFTKIDGKWYLVPQDPSIARIVYTCIGYILLAGDSVDHEMRCGYLPKGDYAVLVDLGTGVTAEFQYDLVEFTV